MYIQTASEVGIKVKSKLSFQTDGYSTILEEYNIKYMSLEYYLQVGEVNITQGWLLHLSAVLSQVDNLLHTIIPVLLNSQVPFKIPQDQSIADAILAGNLGTSQIGKIVSIYPTDNAMALNLAKKLIEITKHFKGPAIPTDFCLGNTVYTRFGSFNPIKRPNKRGGTEKYIYDSNGNLIQDLYCIPFQFPASEYWPFNEITKPILPPAPKLANKIYKVIDILKSDPRGNVFQGLYVKNLLSVKKSVLKQGFTNSDSDLAGRDIRDKINLANRIVQRLTRANLNAQILRFYFRG